ncbi:MAG: oligoendopeptidase F [Phycisphaerae bacterium]
MAKTGMMIMTAGLIMAGTATVGAGEKGASHIPKRSEIDEQHRWNLADIFVDDAAFETAFAAAADQIKQLAELKGTLGQSPESLLRGLQLRDVTEADYERIMLYSGLSYHQDMSVSETQGRNDRAESLGTTLSEAASWFVPEVLAVPEETARSWMDGNAKLAVYRHAIDDIYRQRAHFLSPREEELLAMAGDVTSAPGNIFGRFSNTDLDFPIIKDEKGHDVQLSSAQYYTFIYSPDRRVRRDAFLGLHQAYMNKRNTLSAMLSAQVKQHIFYAKARHFGSSMEAALSGPNVPMKVYENLVATVNRHVGTLHRYVAMRKKLLKLDEVHRYDLYVPMVDAPQDKIPYDDAVETILTALSPVGADYVGTLRNAFESRWIDVYETENKRGGAYCWGSYAVHPFLLLNYHGTMNDRSTVAHEMGHAMHTVYTTKTQPKVYGDYATFCAEVASTVNEVILANYLLKNAKTDTEKLLILQQQIEGIRTTVFRQTMFAEFEKTIHEQAEAGKALTGAGLCETYEKLVRRYYGPELVLDECASAEGLRIPHFYRNFYVFNYATSHCAATNIGRRVLNGEPGAVEGLKRFLSAGSSQYPLDVLKLAGVDMTTPKPIEDTLDLFETLMDQFEALYDKHHKS